MWRWKNLRTLFKCEVFARDYTFRSFAPIESPEIQFDYLTAEKTTLRAVKIDAKKGDFISVTDQNGVVAIRGSWMMSKPTKQA